MKTLDTGTSPVLTVRAPRPLIRRVDEHRRPLGLTRSAYLREALRVALGDRCCLAPGCTCDAPKGGAE